MSMRKTTTTKSRIFFSCPYLHYFCLFPSHLPMSGLERRLTPVYAALHRVNCFSYVYFHNHCHLHRRVIHLCWCVNRQISHLQHFYCSTWQRARVGFCFVLRRVHDLRQQLSCVSFYFAITSATMPPTWSHRWLTWPTFAKLVRHLRRLRHLRLHHCHQTLPLNLFYFYW